VQEAVVSALPEAVQLGEWRLEPELDLISCRERVIKIEPRAMRVLLVLIARAGHVVTVSELLEEVWPDVVVGPDSVYQAIALLRRALGDDRHRPTYIVHVPRRGYRLIAPLAPAAPALPATGEAPAGTGWQNRTALASIESASPATARPPPSKRRVLPAPAWAVIAVLAVLVAAYPFVRDALGRLPPPASVPTAATPVPRAPSNPSVPSIAVLPFVDMTDKQDLAYFADGLSEELIDLLSRDSDLRVPARTSSFYFKGKPTGVGDIARALAVDNVLEGSVRRSGDRVRVTAQLIRADNGYHLWSETYERKFTEIFAVEDDIAQAVVRGLHAQLSAGRAATAASTMSAAARALLLQCQFFLRRNTPADGAKALDCYRELLRLAPQNARAWAGYADALLRKPFSDEVPLAEVRRAAPAARDAAQHAVQLDPTLAPAHAVLASFYRVVEFDLVAATRELNAALAAEPDDPASLLSAAKMAQVLGQLEQAIDYCRRAQVRDPLNFQSYARLGAVYLYQGRLADAEAAVRRRIDLAPEGHGAHMQLVDVLLARGLPHEALAAIELEPDEESRLVGRALTFHALGQRANADAALAAVTARYGQRYPVEIAEIYAYRGETERAFAALDAAFAAGDPALLEIASDSYFKPLHRDRRYQALLRRLKLPEPA
jgi:TolB-like protein/DNA-binding winged helix-turn-helix (wHTH) protein/cytochrome c-type biogenesis protein CcmH/NrfG